MDEGRGRLAEVVGCKWSVEVLRAVRGGIRRPGALARAIPGISTKVLNERLAKLTRLGLVRRTAFPEVPPRVEYALTPVGERLCRLLDELDRLEAELAGAPQPAGAAAGAGRGAAASPGP
jgi:DNA-binding HxlR family transcriptional regulator